MPAVWGSMQEYSQQAHPFAPVVDENCRVLVLGSFPSVKSRENDFYYGHPQNRFWKMLAGVFGECVPVTIAEKKALLLRQHIALWDVLERCEIVGSSDSSIRAAQANDLRRVLDVCDIQAILLNGKTAAKYYEKYCADIQIAHEALPSTSPANAAWSLEKLTQAWDEALREYLPAENA